MKKMYLYWIIAIILIAPALAENMQTINNSNIYLSAQSERIGSGIVPLELQWKGNNLVADFAFGFDEKKTSPKYLEILINTYNITDVNGSINYYQNWTQKNPTQIINYSYDGKTKWYVFQNINIQSNKSYQARMYLEVLDNGKYDWAMKLSSDTIQNAISNNRFYFLDPTYNFTNGLLSFYNANELNGDLIDNYTGIYPYNAVSTPGNVSGIVLGGRNITSGKYFNRDNTFMNFGTGDFTINAWIKNTNSADANTGFIIFNDGWSPTSPCISGVGHELAMTFSIGNGANYGCSNGNYLCLATVKYSNSVNRIQVAMNHPNTWTMVTAIRNGSGTQFSLYVNGVFNSTAIGLRADSLTDNGVSCTNIGAQNSVSGTGQIDDLGIWNRVLNSSEISGLYNSGLGVEYPFILSSFNINFNSQIPINITSTNLLNNSINISYNVTSSAIINLNQTRLFSNVTRNNTLSFWYISGVQYPMNFSLNYTYNLSNTFYWIYDHEFVYASRFNYDPILMESYNKINASIGATTNNWLKVRFYNVSDSRNYNYLLLNIFNTSSSPQPIFYCNSSYSSGNPAISPYCANFYTLFPRPKDAVESSGNSYYVISLGVVNHTINGIKITNPSYFAFEGGESWNFNYISNYTLLDTARVSSNNGNTWTNFSGTPDMHIHQFDNDSMLSYYACSNDSNGIYSCSNSRSQNIGITLLPPTSPNIIQPVGGTYNGTIFINYSQSFSETGTILYYAIYLYDSNFNYVTNISSNNGLNLNYVWNSSLVANGNYHIVVTAFDNQSMNSSDFSDLFTISNILLLFLSRPNIFLFCLSF